MYNPTLLMEELCLLQKLFSSNLLQKIFEMTDLGERNRRAKFTKPL